MHKKILVSLSVLMAGTSLAAQSAQRRFSSERLQILNNHLGDKRADIDARLLATGYKNSGDAYPKCDKTFTTLINEFARNKTFNIPLSRLDCTEIYTRGENEVVAQYLLGQRGYVLAAMTLQYKTAESSKSSVARLSKLYGKAKRSEEAQFRWYEASSSQAPYFQYTRMGGTSAIAIYSSKAMSDTFYRDAEKMVLRLAGNRK